MTVPGTRRDAQRGFAGRAGMPPASGFRSAVQAGWPPGVVAAGGVASDRTFAAVAIAWRTAALHHRQLASAVSRRVAALRASSVDVTVIGCDDSVPAELLAGCRLARQNDEAEVIARPDRALVVGVRIKVAPYAPQDPLLRKLR